MNNEEPEMDTFDSPSPNAVFLVRILLQTFKQSSDTDSKASYRAAFYIYFLNPRCQGGSGASERYLSRRRPSDPNSGPDIYRPYSSS